MRILQVVGRMNYGGTESWLMNVLRHMDRDRHQMDFLVHGTEHYVHSEEIAALGAKLVFCPHQPSFTYRRRLAGILSKHKYDIVHSHLQYFNGLVLQSAAEAGVPCRIAHSHSSNAAFESRSPFRQLYIHLMKRWMSKHITGALAASRSAAASLYGSDWRRDPRVKLHYCGIDLSPFQHAMNRREYAAQLGIPPDAYVVGHIGRLEAPKNHRFLLLCFKEAALIDPRLLLLCVGDGSLRGQLESDIRDLDLQDRVILTGARSDIPHLLQTMDLFVLPSLYEGLPLTVIEAQAAGVPVLMSEAVTDEVMISSREQVLKLPLRKEEWVQALLKCSSDRRQSPPSFPASMIGSDFDIRCSTQALFQYYENQLLQSRRL